MKYSTSTFGAALLAACLAHAQEESPDFSIEVADQPTGGEEALSGNIRVGGDAAQETGSAELEQLPGQVGGGAADSDFDPASLIPLGEAQTDPNTEIDLNTSQQLTNQVTTEFDASSFLQSETAVESVIVTTSEEETVVTEDPLVNIDTTSVAITSEVAEITTSEVGIELSSTAVLGFTSSAVAEITTPAVVEITSSALAEITSSAVAEITTSAVVEITSSAVAEITTSGVAEIPTPAIVNITSSAVPGISSSAAVVSSGVSVSEIPEAAPTANVGNQGAVLVSVPGSQTIPSSSAAAIPTVTSAAFGLGNTTTSSSAAVGGDPALSSLSPLVPIGTGASTIAGVSSEANAELPTQVLGEGSTASGIASLIPLPGQANGTTLAQLPGLSTGVSGAVETSLGSLEPVLPGQVATGTESLSLSSLLGASGTLSTSVTGVTASSAFSGANATAAIMDPAAASDVAEANDDNTNGASGIVAAKAGLAGVAAVMAYLAL
ncbi:hypothetical protein MKZ38_002428 [Zalerion maritima]|uniref:Uncharacterized protein n=1 Tax=Zalerion maritima TaxID=339359 RepID=A0AAD5WSG8_9PEZI|nr:hypothetical protein MKZ38_002428 [Zalerion maritima]